MENFPGDVRAKADGQMPGAQRAACELGGSARALRACSACAGDYEDPERTAPQTDEALSEEDEAAVTIDETDDENAARDKSPAEEA